MLNKKQHKRLTTRRLFFLFVEKVNNSKLLLTLWQVKWYFKSIYCITCCSACFWIIFDSLPFLRCTAWSFPRAHIRYSVRFPGMSVELLVYCFNVLLLLFLAVLLSVLPLSTVSACLANLPKLLILRITSAKKTF